MPPHFNPVGWFEIPVHDMARAKTFYQHVLGIQLSEQRSESLHMALFPVFEGAMGTTGSLVQGAYYTPGAQGVVIYFTAPDIDACIARATKGGGRVIREKTSIGHYGFIAIVEDTEGNRIGLHARA
jgi:predicted enzyme related to lactoylglutathione lyase